MHNLTPQMFGEDGEPSRFVSVDPAMLNRRQEKIDAAYERADDEFLEGRNV